MRIPGPNVAPGALERIEWEARNAAVGPSRGSTGRSGHGGCDHGRSGHDGSGHGVATTRRDAAPRDFDNAWGDDNRSRTTVEETAIR